MNDVQKLQKEVQVLIEEADLAISQADRWSETAWILEQENNELKATLNRLVTLVHEAPGRDVNGQDVLGIIYGTQ